MNTPQILTGQQAIDQYGLNALIECRVAVTTELNGLGYSVMQIGVIADPKGTFTDDADDGVLLVEYELDGEWYLYSIPDDEQFVLLDDKNQPAKTYGAKTPEQIYLIPDAEHGQVWSDTPAPGEGMREEDATRYVREDVYLALQAQVEQLKQDIDIGAKDYCGLMERHDALFVQVDQLRDLLIRAVKGEQYIIESDLIAAIGSDLQSEISEAIDATPAQCLQEIQADAYWKGYVAGGDDFRSRIKIPLEVVTKKASELIVKLYPDSESAKKIRQQAKAGK